MEKEPKRPLYVDDIRAAAENSDAIQRDIIEQAEALRQEIAANQGASYEDVHAFMYKVGIFVLKKLQEKGIDDALELEGRLEELDNLHPNRSRADMFTVASYYETTSQESGIGYEEQLRRKKQAATAWATQGVINFEAARRTHNDNTMERFYEAEETIKGVGFDIPDYTHDALIGLLVELRAGLHDD